MKHPFSYSIPCLTGRIKADVTPLDTGIHLLVTGGTRTHVGAITLCHPGEEPRTILHGGSEEDAQLAELFAGSLMNLLHCPITVAAGIDFGEIARAEYPELAECIDNLLNKTLDFAGFSMQE